MPLGCASGCVVECRICTRDVSCSNLGRGYFAPRSTQPSIPPESVNEYRCGQRQDGSFRLRMKRRVHRQVKLFYTRSPYNYRDVSCGGATQIDYLYVYLYNTACSLTFRAETFQFLEVSGRLCDAQVSASVDGIDGWQTDVELSSVIRASVFRYRVKRSCQRWSATHATCSPQNTPNFFVISSTIFFST